MALPSPLCPVTYLWSCKLGRIMLNFNRLIAGWLAFCYAVASLAGYATMLSAWMFFLLGMLGLLLIFIMCDEINRPKH